MDGNIILILFYGNISIVFINGIDLQWTPSFPRRCNEINVMQ